MYEIDERPVGVSAHLKLYQSKREKLKAGIIVFNPRTQAMKVFSSANVIGVTIQLRKRSILIMSVYCPPSENLELTLQQIDQCLSIPHDGTIIAGDFNAKSPVWSSTIEDDRGKELVDFALSQRLAIVNEENSPPTFDGSRGASWIDVTLCDAPMIEHIFKWQVDMEPTSSDHNSISFSLYTDKTSVPKKTRTKLENLYLGTFRSELANTIGRWPPPSLYDAHSIDQEIERLVTNIAECCRGSRLKLTPLNKREPWWTQKLEVMRSDAPRAQRK
ncbi:hypothetical protein AVEN_242871-1 [Araneus ventricosus]|uniref:Endonuclease/exonuclease/phosphatase domain-containing protein n=1 Tax=Araneus ventricosus TaxID=182803 RepID=A0A4Y2R5X3_ARAVE|nr:hypothetical protein AVEN_242871-1 [Araneus ventricosus]